MHVGDTVLSSTEARDIIDFDLDMPEVSMPYPHETSILHTTPLKVGAMLDISSIPYNETTPEDLRDQLFTFATLHRAVGFRYDDLNENSCQPYSLRLYNAKNMKYISSDFGKVINNMERTALLDFLDKHARDFSSLKESTNFEKDKKLYLQHVTEEISERTSQWKAQYRALEKAYEINATKYDLLSHDEVQLRNYTNLVSFQKLYEQNNNDLPTMINDLNELKTTIDELEDEKQKIQLLTILSKSLEFSNDFEGFLHPLNDIAEMPFIYPTTSRNEKVLETTSILTTGNTGQQVPDKSAPETSHDSSLSPSNAKDTEASDPKPLNTRDPSTGYISKTNEGQQDMSESDKRVVLPVELPSESDSDADDAGKEEDAADMSTKNGNTEEESRKMATENEGSVQVNAGPSENRGRRVTGRRYTEEQKTEFRNTFSLLQKKQITLESNFRRKHIANATVEAAADNLKKEWLELQSPATLQVLKDEFQKDFEDFFNSITTPYNQQNGDTWTTVQIGKNVPKFEESISRVTEDVTKIITESNKFLNELRTKPNDTFLFQRRTTAFEKYLNDKKRSEKSMDKALIELKVISWVHHFIDFVKLVTSKANYNTLKSNKADGLNIPFKEIEEKIKSDISGDESKNEGTAESTDEGGAGAAEVDDEIASKSTDEEGAELVDGDPAKSEGATGEPTGGDEAAQPAGDVEMEDEEAEASSEEGEAGTADGDTEIGEGATAGSVNDETPASEKKSDPDALSQTESTDGGKEAAGTPAATEQGADGDSEKKRLTELITSLQTESNELKSFKEVFEATTLKISTSRRDVERYRDIAEEAHTEVLTEVEYVNSLSDQVRKCGNITEEYKEIKGLVEVSKQECVKTIRDCSNIIESFRAEEKEINDTVKRIESWINRMDDNLLQEMKNIVNTPNSMSNEQVKKIKTINDQADEFITLLLENRKNIMTKITKANEVHEKVDDIVLSIKTTIGIILNDKENLKLECDNLQLQVKSCESQKEAKQDEERYTGNANAIKKAEGKAETVRGKNDANESQDEAGAPSAGAPAAPAEAARQQTKEETVAKLNEEVDELRNQVRILELRLVVEKEALKTITDTKGQVPFLNQIKMTQEFIAVYKNKIDVLQNEIQELEKGEKDFEKAIESCEAEKTAKQNEEKAKNEAAAEAEKQAEAARRQAEKAKLNEEEYELQEELTRLEVYLNSVEELIDGKTTEEDKKLFRPGFAQTQESIAKKKKELDDVKKKLKKIKDDEATRIDAEATKQNNRRRQTRPPVLLSETKSEETIIKELASFAKEDDNYYGLMSTKFDENIFNHNLFLQTPVADQVVRFLSLLWRIKQYLPSQKSTDDTTMIPSYLSKKIVLMTDAMIDHTNLKSILDPTPPFQIKKVITEDNVRTFALYLKFIKGGAYDMELQEWKEKNSVKPEIISWWLTVKFEAIFLSKIFDDLS